MKILVCGKGYCSGWNQSKSIPFIVDQASALKQAGHDVRIVSVDSRSLRKIRPHGLQRSIQRDIPSFFYSLPVGPIHPLLCRPLCIYAANKAIAAAVADGWTPDVVHAHFGDIAFAFARFAKKKGIPFVVTEHFSGMNQIQPPNHRVLELCRYSYLQADRLLAVGETLKGNIQKHTGYSATVVPNVLDSVFFTSCHSATEPQPGFQFITAGHLIPRKNHEIVIKTFAKLPYPDARLVICGDGPLRQELETLAQTLNVQDRVCFLGNVSRELLAQKYHESSCFVLASRLETFGVVYIEAMACGLPVIATRCGGPEDFVTPENGCLIDCDSPDQLESAMKEAYLNRNRFSSHEISDFAYSRYSPDVIAYRLTEHYRDLLSNRKQSSV